jgi:hypothetical protein
LPNRDRGEGEVDLADQAQTDQLVFDYELGARPQKVWRALSIAGFARNGCRSSMGRRSFVGHDLVHQGVAEIGFQRRDLVRKDHPIEQVPAAVLSMIGEQIASMMIGTHEDREGIVAADANKQRSIPGSEWIKERDAETASRAVKEYMATLDDRCC